MVGMRTPNETHTQTIETTITSAPIAENVATHTHPDRNITDDNLQKDTITDIIMITIREIKLHLEMIDHTTLTTKIITDITTKITTDKIIITTNKIIITREMITPDPRIMSITSQTLVTLSTTLTQEMLNTFLPTWTPLLDPSTFES